MFASKPSPHVTKKRKPYSPPKLIKLTPEAAQAALENLGKERDDKSDRGTSKTCLYGPAVRVKRRTLEMRVR
jgi:hypothetical protein